MARYLSGPTQPFGKWNNISIYLTTILTAVFVAGLIGTALLTAARSPLLEAFVFTMPLRPAWTVWRLLTYVFVSPVNFFTPFAILCFYWFSVGIETHLGRVVITRLLLLLVLVPPAVGAFCWWVLGISSGAADNYLLTSGLLVAFATLYPNTEAWGWIPFKWIAFACIFCGSLMMLASHDWLSIAELWISCAVGFAYIRHAKDLEYDDYVSPVARVQQLFQRKPKFRVVPAPAAGNYRTAAAAEEPESELDGLLDKIAKSGINSLTTKEKATLEKAREALIRKDQR